MEILFLGTSSGVPTKTRNLPATIVKIANSKRWCLVDCGEGTQHQLLRVSLTVNNLDTIFITHMHGDHCYGLPGLLASATMCNRTNPLTIIGPPELKDFLAVVQKATAIDYPFELIIQPFSSGSELIETSDLSLDDIADCAFDPWRPS